MHQNSRHIKEKNKFIYRGMLNKECQIIFKEFQWQSKNIKRFKKRRFFQNSKSRKVILPLKKRHMMMLLKSCIKKL
jgi:hypothetical protein